MEIQREGPPACFQDEPSTLKLPSVPSHDVSSPPSHTQIKLPDLRSLGLPEARQSNDGWTHYRQNGHLNPSAFPSVPTNSPRGPVEPSLGSPMATESVVSMEERGMRAPSVMSMDDPETRMAAEALSGLRNPDFMRSPSARSATLPSQHSALRPEASFSPLQADGEEPLLSLVTANHPWLGGTINGSIAAYNTTKYYSPALVRSSAEFVERNIGSPVASTFASVSRRTGVENGLRRYLGDRRPSDLEAEDIRRHKRLRESSPEKDVERGLQSPNTIISEQLRRSRAGSQGSFQSLPPYDENRSPRYEELAPLVLQDPATQQPLSPSRNWRTQLMITTSGLGAALSETSLKNLGYCLNLLRGATVSITTMMTALRKLLDDYEESTRGPQDAHLSNYTISQEQEAASSRIAESIKSFHRDIMRTLEHIKNSISHYTGGALPENAGALVRRQLMSIPQRWRVAESTAEQDSANNNGAPQNETVRNGNKLVHFASQSLDMLAQVSMIVGATIENAEGWLDRMGRRPREQSQMTSPGFPDNKSFDYRDVSMGDRKF